MKNETAFNTALAKELRSLGCHVQRIENRMSSGIPDMNVCYKGAEFWIEGKFVRRVKKNGEYDSGVTGLQKNWHLARKKADGVVYTAALISVTSEINPFRFVLLDHDQEFIAQFATVPELARFLVGEVS